MHTAILNSAQEQSELPDIPAPPLVPRNSSHDIHDLLIRHDIHLKDEGVGQHSTTCPCCSSNRKRLNQRKPCLGVKIDEKGACWNCAHCGWSGPEKGMGQSSFNIVRTYDYEDADGKLLFQVCRLSPKDFRQRRPDAGGKWIWKLGDTERVPYCLPEVLQAIKSGEEIFVTEGEKDVETLMGLGLTATCNSGGAEKWGDSHNRYLEGADVIIVPDNDEAGAAHELELKRRLTGVANSIRIVRIPDGCKDISAWIEAKHTRAEFDVLVARAADETCEQTGSDAEAKASDEPTEDYETPWPVLNDVALHGLAGDVVRVLEPHTESDPAAILFQFLLYFGNAVGRGPYYQVEGDRHYTNEYGIMAGKSGKGRKGTSAGRVRQIFEIADLEWATKCTDGGLSSGEGLIWKIRDPETKTKNGEVEVVDQGVSDKRLLCSESEMAAAFMVMQRPGNTLSRIVRDLWDRGNVGSMTKNSPAKTTGAHVSIVGHITSDEIRRLLDGTSAVNGFANRFMMWLVKRSKVLPHGGNIDEKELKELARQVALRLGDASARGRVTMTADAAALWEHVYPDLSEGAPGLVGAITGRAEAHVVRVAMIYALLDSKGQIGEVHLKAALGVWEYADLSAAYIFGDSTGDPIADDVMTALRGAGEEGLSRTDIRDICGHARRPASVDASLRLLLKLRRARTFPEKTSGRPRQMWIAVKGGR